MGKFLTNKGFEKYLLARMFEKIKFDMDHKGARVESEAGMTVAAGMVAKAPKIRRFILDQPFWVVIKRKRLSIHILFLVRETWNSWKK